MIKGTDQLAAEIFGFPVQVRGPRGVKGLSSMVDNPQFSTGVGLVIYGSIHAKEGDVFRGDESKIFDKILKRMRDWWNEFFS